MSTPSGSKPFTFGSRREDYRIFLTAMPCYAAELRESEVQMDRFVAAINNRFDAIDSRFESILARLDGHGVILKKFVDDLGQLKGAHARNAVLESAGIIAKGLGLRRTTSLSREEL